MRDDQRLLVGLDEAGRGSVFGPLVVGAFAIRGTPRGTHRRLVAAGARDSKTLTPKRRTEVLRRLRIMGETAYAAAEPALIDRYVRDGRLNELELVLMTSLVVRLRPEVVVVDACDPDAERFGRNLADRSARAGCPVEVHAHHKADRDFPVVGASSIVAKVERDRAIARIARRAGRDLGSGYPSDRVTRECLREILKVRPLPPYVRRSWATVDILMRERSLRPLESFGP